MGISWAELHWNTVAEFEAHLAKYDPAIASWANGVTVHHTVAPTVKQWRGSASMNGMKAFYRDTRGWDGAPHLYIAPDGIWQANPLNVPGIHAGRCNADHWGVEVVGNYDTGFWEEPIYSFAYGAITALMRWRGLSVNPESLLGHRDCLPNKSCPGKAVNMNVVRDEVRKRLNVTRGTSEAPGRTVDVSQYDSTSTFNSAPKGVSTDVAVKFVLKDNPTCQYDEAAIRTIIESYKRQCAEVGLNWELVFAQCLHETGRLSSWWCARDRRNPAGLGVNGTTSKVNPVNDYGWYHDTKENIWKAGFAFPAWDGPGGSVEAHIAHLLLYIYTNEEMSQKQLDFATKSPGKARLEAYHPEYRGTVKTLQGLFQTWAWSQNPSKNVTQQYPARIAAMANRMCAYAKSQ